MKHWTVPDLLELSDAITSVGLCSFVVRRALQRMERGEIAPLEAAEIIRTHMQRAVQDPHST